MDLQPYVSAVAEDLDRAAALADDHTREVARRVATAIEPAVRLALVQALSDAASGLTTQLDDAVVTVRMEGREPVLEVRRLPGDAPLAPPPPPRPPAPGEQEDEGGEDGGTARLTVRLPGPLKRRAEERAGEEGQSLNTWVVHVIREATGSTPTARHTDQSTRHPRRVTGWA